MTDRFNPSDPEHLAIKEGIEIGDGIEALATGCFSKRFCAEAALSERSSWESVAH